MNKIYSITIKAETTYEIEAKNEKMALNRAFEYWDEYNPAYTIREITELRKNEKINCKTTKCENCKNHNYCDYESIEKEQIKDD